VLTDRPTDVWTNRRMGGWTDCQIDVGWMDRLTDIWTNRRTVRGTDRQMDG
jgi:hypothetical protein